MLELSYVLLGFFVIVIMFYDKEVVFGVIYFFIVVFLFYYFFHRDVIRCYGDVRDGVIVDNVSRNVYIWCGEGFRGRRFVAV